MFGKKSKNDPLKISIVGMNERALQLFMMFLDGPARGSCQVVNDGAQDAVVIDLDGVESPRLWLDVRRKFHGPVIVLSVTEKQLSNAFWVAKPVDAGHFLPVINKVKEAVVNAPAAPAKPAFTSPPVQAPRGGEATAGVQPVKGESERRKADENEPKSTSPAAQLMSEEMDERSQNCCGNLQDDVYRGSRSQDEVFFNPSATLLGIFREAMKLTTEGGVAKIAGLGPYPIYLGVHGNFTSTAMHEPYLRALCARAVDASPISVELIELERKAIGMSEDPRLRRLDDMLWRISLWSSRGRVPAGTSLTAPVRLRSWPNIPRLMMVPHGMRIAALWVTQPSGLLDTAQKLGVPYRFVFAFYCACQSFDLVEQQAAGERAATPSHEVSAKPEIKEKRGLFGSLLKKLGFG